MNLPDRTTSNSVSLPFSGDLRAVARQIRYRGYRTVAATQPGDYCKVIGNGFTLRLRTGAIIIVGNRSAAQSALRGLEVAV